MNSAAIDARIVCTNQIFPFSEGEWYTGAT